jgi:AAA domain, putative AbiEii toxin, Type IV TA system
MPHLSVGGIGDIEESWRITSSGRDVGATDDAGYAEALSSGERRWVDEALATLARSVADLGRRCAWQSWFWDKANADDEAVLGEVLQLLPAGEGEAVPAEVLAHVAELFDTTLTAVAREWIADATAPVELWHALVPALSDITRPPLTIRVLDEPEAHLHPAAQRQLATGLSQMAAGNDLVLASHSPYLLGQRDWTYCSVSNGRAAVLPSPTLDVAGALAREVGLTQGELLVTTRAVLLVEGLHDQVFLRILFGDELREAGIAVVPIHGTKGAPNLVDSQFWLAFTGTPFHVMFDNTRLTMVRDRAVANTLLTTEERTMRKLLTSVASAGRALGAIGLARPDISAYIAEQVLPGDFPGWTAVLDRWKREEQLWRRKTGAGFKPWLAERYTIDQLTASTIDRYARRMKEAGAPPPGDLSRKINRLIARPDRVDS